MTTCDHLILTPFNLSDVLYGEPVDLDDPQHGEEILDEGISLF